MARVSAGSLERDLVPAEARDAHVDGVAARASGHGQHAGRRLDRRARAAPLLHHQTRDAARAVAAGTGLGAVGIVHPHEHVRPLGRLETQQLIATHAEAAVGDAPGLRGAERQLAAPAIEDHEVVAEAVHLVKGELVHGAQYRPTPGATQLPKCTKSAALP